MKNMQENMNGHRQTQRKIQKGANKSVESSRYPQIGKFLAKIHFQQKDKNEDSDRKTVPDFSLGIEGAHESRQIQILRPKLNQITMSTPCRVITILAVFAVILGTYFTLTHHPLSLELKYSHPRPKLSKDPKMNKFNKKTQTRILIGPQLSKSAAMNAGTGSGASNSGSMASASSQEPSLAIAQGGQSTANSDSDSEPSTTNTPNQPNSAQSTINSNSNRPPLKATNSVESAAPNQPKAASASSPSPKKSLPKSKATKANKSTETEKSAKNSPQKEVSARCDPYTEVEDDGQTHRCLPCLQPEDFSLNREKCQKGADSSIFLDWKIDFVKELRGSELLNHAFVKDLKAGALNYEDRVIEKKIQIFEVMFKIDNTGLADSIKHRLRELIKSFDLSKSSQMKWGQIFEKMEEKKKIVDAVSSKALKGGKNRRIVAQKVEKNYENFRVLLGENRPPRAQIVGQKSSESSDSVELSLLFSPKLANNATVSISIQDHILTNQASQGTPATISGPNLILVNHTKDIVLPKYQKTTQKAKTT